MSPLVSIIIPTQRRPEPLRAASMSVLQQQGVPPTELELVIVDNDAAGSGRRVAEDVRRQSPFPVRYVHEPSPGVANARNAGVTASRGRWIAFLDDDEVASCGWLAALLAVQSEFAVDVVFGPVLGRAPAKPPALRVYFEDFFSRKGPGRAGVIEQPFGCGNSLLARTALPNPDQPFTAERNRIGGEDDVLFAQMKQNGARFAWAPAAWVLEHPSADRLTLAYTLRRAFAYGQGASNRFAAAEPPNRCGVARSMIIGFAQACVFTVAACIAGVAKARSTPALFDRAARGLGKVLWWKAFHQQFYGFAAGQGSRPHHLEKDAAAATHPSFTVRIDGDFIADRQDQLQNPGAAPAVKSLQLRTVGK